MNARQRVSAAGHLPAILRRGREIHEIEAALAAVGEGSGRAILVAGEPGIGKTRLAEEAARLAAARGFQVVWGACWEGGGAPAFWPWVQVIRACSGRVPEAERRRFAAAAGALARAVPALQDLAEAGELPAADSEPARLRLFDATAGLLRSTARSAPLLVVLDDIHAADESSLRLLQFVLRDLRGTPIAVVATYRDTEVQPHFALAEVVAALTRDGQRLRLAGLGVEDVGEVMARMAATPPAPALVEAVHEVTGGNPFFVEEIVQVLITERRLDRPPTQALHNLRLPEEVREAVRRHARPLPRETVRLLSIAAVLGRDFDRAALERLSNELAHGTPPHADGCREWLRPAIAAGVVAETPGGGYHFVHALIAETLYGDLLSDERTALHRAAATALEALHAHRGELHLAEIAHHWYRAAPAGEVARAIDYQMRAGAQALQHCAHEQASELFERGLELCDRLPSPDESRRGELLLALGEAQMRGVATVRAKATFERAAEQARARGVGDRLARAVLGIADAGIGLPGMECDAAMVRLLRESLSALPAGDGRLRARVLGRLAVELYNQPDSAAERRALVDDALAMARRLGDPLSLARAFNDAHYALWRVGNLSERLALARDTVRLADAADSTELALRGYWWLILDLIEAGDAGFEAAIDEAGRRADALRQPRYQWIATQFRAVRALSRGDIAAAEELAMQAFAHAERASEPAAGQLLTGFLFAVRVMQGRLAEFEPAMRAHLGQFPDQPNLHCGMAWMYAELGRHDEARAELESIAARGYDVLVDNYNRLIALAYLAETAAVVGDRARAAELYALLLPLRDRCVALGHPNTFIDPPVAHFLGLLTTALERWDEAQQHFEASLAMIERMGMPPHAARTRYAYARMLACRRRAGDRARATALAEQALATARAVGMVALEQRVAALAEALRVDPSVDRDETDLSRRRGT